jgi:hypothetical protein
MILLFAFKYEDDIKNAITKKMNFMFQNFIFKK